MGPSPGLRCPQCNHSSPPGSLQCTRCSAPFVSESQTVTGGNWSMAVSDAPLEMKAFEPGAVLANRYEIVSLLGEGGMGAVYRARDRELDRLVALKVIRPELAGHPAVLQRFKRELILAREVTHRNVIRIFDLGTAGNLKFITMEYVDGRDLSAVLEERRPGVEEAVRIVRQVARALEAAHAASVVHRDLKPQNIMLGEDGRVWVMDFGLARTLESTGLTQTGAILGTPAYMSPEQAQGITADARSDIFSLGIIFYELLTGVVPFQADTILASMLKRTQEAPPRPADLDPGVPRDASDVAMRCLAINPAERYQTASDLLRDLDVLAGGTGQSLLTTSLPRVTAPASAIPAAAPAPRQSRRRWWLIAGAAAAAAAMAATYVLVSPRGSTPVGPARNTTVLVADFHNATGEPIFNGTLEPMLTLALEGASFINTIRHDQAMRIARQIQPDATQLTEQLARLVAVREGIAVVIGGSIRRSDTYEIAVRAVDAVTGRLIAKGEVKAANKEGVLGTIGKLSAPIRGALGDSTPESVQTARAETFTASSLESAQRYSAAQELRFAGKGEEAVQEYLKTIAMDPEFGSAYASLAAVYANLGQREQATKYYKLAMTRIDRMSDREKYRTRGGYYLAVMDPLKAVEELSGLVKQFPADTMGRSSLAFAHYLRRDMAKALEEGRRALEIYPRNVPYRNNVALYALYASDFDTAAKESAAALQQNASYLKGYITLALAEVGRGQRAKAEETYSRLRGVSPLGASFACTGLADLALYEGRPADAFQLLEKGAAEDLANKNGGAAAKKLVMAAEAHLQLGRKQPAAALLDRAVGLARESVLFPAARAYIEAGQEAKAAALGAELGRKFESVPQAGAKLIAGELELKRGRPREAIRLLLEAGQISDTWLARFSLGRAYLAAEAFPQADSEFDFCLRRRGEASDVFMDEQQTFHFLPPVHYYIGRVREGMQSPGAAESYRTFLGMRANGSPDRLAEEARKRLAGL